ncbi:hypothetical protein [Streptomyces sp. NBC_01508]|uniref:hypothetical protein n=1 Tax=Streptomyces sp. NBC_01508 TaxID=2903888 RepID=UPI00386F0EE3
MSDAASASSALRPYPKISARGRLGLSGVREWIAVEKMHGAHSPAVFDAEDRQP